MNPLLPYVNDAIRLQEENRQLRAMMSALVVAICRNGELLAMARGELLAVWPETEKGDHAS